jgi:hypothetical protein
MAISRTTTAGQHPFSLIAKKQFRPTGSPAPKGTSPNSISEPSGNNFYKLMALLLLMMSGCNEATTKKEGESPIQENIVANPLNPILKIKTNSTDIDRRIIEARKNLFNKHLLLTIDELSDLHDDAYRVGRGLPSQMLISKRLEAEMFPVLWSKVFLEGPDEVMVAEFSEPGEFHGEDFGRGLRLILRKQIGGLNTSTILFLDYNEKTKKLEFPQDFFFNDKRRIIPDAMRMLIEYDVQPTAEELKGHKRKYYTDYLNSGFFGTTISAQIDDKTPRVNDFHIYPTRDDNDEQPVSKDGRSIGVVSLLGCVGCHERKEGFGSTGTSFEKLQRDVHLRENQNLAIKHFLKSIEGRKYFDSPQERTEILADLETKLQNPRENLLDLMPTGFLDALKMKQSTFTHPSSVLNR